jgi:hypothetical protein
MTQSGHSRLDRPLSRGASNRLFLDRPLAQGFRVRSCIRSAQLPNAARHDLELDGPTSLAGGPAYKQVRITTMRDLRRHELELPPVRIPAVAMGALAVGALALGALAIGALAIARLSILRADLRKVHLGEVEIDDLTVRRLRVIETAPADYEPS